MAAKESVHRETVDSLKSDLSRTRRQLEELTVLSRDQVRCHHDRDEKSTLIVNLPWIDAEYVQRD